MMFVLKKVFTRLNALVKVRVKHHFYVDTIGIYIHVNKYMMLIKSVQCLNLQRVRNDIYYLHISNIIIKMLTFSKTNKNFENRVFLHT